MSPFSVDLVKTGSNQLKTFFYFWNSIKLTGGQYGLMNYRLALPVAAAGLFRFELGLGGVVGVVLVVVVVVVVVSVW